MIKRSSVFLLACAFLCVCVPPIACAQIIPAQEVTADGVRYYINEEAAYVEGFEEGVHTFTLLPEFMGRPVLIKEKCDASCIEELIMAEGIVSWPQFDSEKGLSSLRRVVFPSTYAFDADLDDHYSFFDTWFEHAGLLEEIQLPANISKETVLYFVFLARDMMDYSQYEYYDSYSYDEPYDPAFYRSFSRIFIDPEHPTLYDVDGVIFEKGTDRLLACLPGRTGALNVPPGTTAIAESAFSYCYLLERVMLPPSVTIIEDRGFAISSLQSILLPLTLETIGEYAFDNCISLTSIVIPQGTTVEKNAFRYCVGLHTVYAPFKATQIAIDAFAYGSPDLVVYAPEGSDAYMAAITQDIPWAEIGDTPQKLPNPNRVHGQAAIVHDEDVTKQLPLYTEANTSSKVLTQYEVGTTVEVLSEADEWVKVKQYETVGYMPLASLQLLYAKDELERILSIEIINPSEKDLYVGPSLAAQAFSSPGYRESYNVIQSFGTWYVVEYEGTVRYVPVQRAQPNAMNQKRLGGDVSVICAKEREKRTLLYREPSITSECLGEYYDGMQLIRLSYETYNGFYHVRIGEQEGYVDCDSLTVLWDVWFYYAW